jgi:hypothetical protein
LTQRDAEKFLRSLFREKEGEAILQRLDRLSQNEARTTAAEILKVIYGLVRNMSEQRHSI